MYLWDNAGKKTKLNKKTYGNRKEQPDFFANFKHSCFSIDCNEFLEYKNLEAFFPH